MSYERRYQYHGSRLAHLVVAGMALGKRVPDGAIVHHRDRDGSNNEKTNLIICEDQEYHKFIHLREDAYRETGDAHKRKCRFCHQWDDPANLQESIGRGYHNFYHRPCRSCIKPGVIGRKWR